MACTERACRGNTEKREVVAVFSPATTRSVALLQLREEVTEIVCSESWVAAAPSPAFPRQEDMMRPQSPRAVRCHLVRRERQVLVVRG